MAPDDELCLCFHVTWRKAINFIRIEKIQTASRISECGGAGTGCGWCRKQLAKLVEQMQHCQPDASEVDAWLADRSPDKRAYIAGREQYREAQATSHPFSDDPPNHPLGNS